MARAIAELPHLDAFGAAEAIAARVPATAPRRSGRLAAGFKPGRDGEDATVDASGVDYAVPIHWGSFTRHIRANRFVYPAAHQAEPAQAAALEKAGQKLCDGVHGA
jgi:hypothetical protein